ncbi:MAG: dTMP kinase [Acidimicrobiia bacterium]|nr:dTMP kinase [Acidimicrobiia bacterium]
MNDAAGRGIFVVLEGGEGTGKTTQVRALAARLRESGREVVETFEPGDGVVGGRIRELLLDPGLAPEPVTEVLLYAADRAEHVRTVVRPALARGADVVCDRFLWSSLAYQGIARGLGARLVESANAAAVDGCEPDVTIVLDVDPGVGLVRAGRACGRAPDRIESESLEFHELVRRGFRDLAAVNGAPVVDAGRGVDEVGESCWDLVRELLATRSGGDRR